MAKVSLPSNSIIEGDVLDILSTFPENSVDITVTSPPYNKRNKTNGWLVTNTKYSNFDDHMPEDQYQAWQIEVLNALLRVMKPGGSLFYNHKLRWDDGALLHPITWIAKSAWCIRQEIVWDRGLAANMRGWRFWQVDERLYWLYKPIGEHLVGQEILSKHAQLSSIWRLRPAPRMEAHPAPFPLELPIRAIYSMPPTEPKVVLDPFSGTGTTLVAATLLGHSYIGIDHSPTYVRFAEQRVLNAETERPKVQDEISRHFIGDPFAARKKRGTISWPYGPKRDSAAQNKKEETGKS